MRGLGLGLGLNRGVSSLAFNPSILFADGEAGGWYDPSDLSTMFQDVAGTIPALPGDPVGLVLDARKEMGPELVANGDFEDGETGWTLFSTSGTTSAEVIDGVVRVSQNGPSAGGLIQDFALPVGVTAIVSFRARRSTGTPTPFTGLWAMGAANFTMNRAAIQVSTDWREYSLFVVGGSAQGRVYISPQVDGMWVEVSNVSVRELPGNHLSQPTASARPTLGRMPKTGRRNVLPYSKDFNSPNWSTFAATISGELFSDTAVEGRKYANMSIPGSGPSIPVAVSAEFQMTDHRYVSLTAGDNGNRSATAIVDLLTGEVTNYSNSGIVGILQTPVIHQTNDGWFRVGFSGATLGSGSLSLIGVGLVADATGGTIASGGYGNYSGSLGSVKVRNVQAEIATETGPYQLVNNAFDVTEAGVPDCYYLRPDLTDDALTTVLPQAVNGDILIAGRNGTIIEPVSYAASSTLSLGPDTYTGGTPGILDALGDIVGVLLIDKTLTQLERDNLIAYYKKKGAKGLLVPGPELVVNGSFETADGWNVAADCSISGGNLNLGGTVSRTNTYAVAIPSGIYQVEMDIASKESGNDVSFRVLAGSSNVANTGWTATPQLVRRVLPVSQSATAIGIQTGGGGFVGKIGHVSVRELRAEEDWT